MSSTNKRPICFFDILVDGKAKGRIQCQLFNDIVPKTCENFMKLCQGTNELGPTTGKVMTYKGCTVHRIKYNKVIETGDFSHNDGSGGESIFGGTFEDENFDVKHNEKYMLTMVNNGPNTNGSQFAFTRYPEYEMDEKNVAFGKIVKGKFIIDSICKIPVDKTFKPIADIVISRCGIMGSEEGEISYLTSSNECVIRKPGKKEGAKRQKRGDSVEFIEEVINRPVIKRPRRMRLPNLEIPTFNDPTNPLERNTTENRPYNELDRHIQYYQNDENNRGQHHGYQHRQHDSGRYDIQRDYRGQRCYYGEDSSSREGGPVRKVKGRGIPRYQPYLNTSIPTPAYVKEASQRIIPMKKAQELINRNREEARTMFLNMPDEAQKRKEFPLFNPEHEKAIKERALKEREIEATAAEIDKYFGCKNSYGSPTYSPTTPSTSSSQQHFDGYHERPKTSLLGPPPTSGFYNQSGRSYSSSAGAYINNNNYRASASDVARQMESMNILSPHHRPPPIPLNEVVCGNEDMFIPPLPPPRTTSTNYQYHQQQHSTQHPKSSYQQAPRFFF